MQPTVVDHQAFLIWKDECLNTFKDIWAPIYTPTIDKEGSLSGGDEESINFLNQCTETLFLVNVVDNNYITGDLNKIILDFIEQHQEKIVEIN